MVLQIVKTPSGKFSVFHHPTDSWVAEELDLRLLREFFKMFIDGEVCEIVAAIESGATPYGPDELAWEQLEEIYREFSGDLTRPIRVDEKKKAA